MARRFAFVSFGILCLVVAYQLGTEQAQADWDPSGNGVVLGISAGDSYPVVWSNDGSAWSWDSELGWNHYAPVDLPVSVSDVKLLSGHNLNILLVTRDDRVFAWERYGSQTWQERPRLPVGPVSLRSGSWGGVKGLFRDAAR